MTIDPRVTASPRRGILPTLRDRLFGERDAVAERLRQHERRARRSVRLAHMAAFALVVLLSLGSLVASSADALRSVQDEWARGRLDLPASISLGVSLLMVIAMDTAILHAARSIRRVASGRAGCTEVAIHVVVLIICSALEAVTFVYMSWLYDRPDTAAAWAIIVLRGLTAPLLGVYLSLVRPRPVGPRDVLHQVELGAGAGFIRDVTELVNDPDAPLERKVELYYVAAPMAPSERERMDGVLAALRDVGTADDPPRLALPDMVNHVSRPRSRRAVVHMQPSSPLPQQPSAVRARRGSEGSAYDDAIDGVEVARGGLRSNVRTPRDSASDDPVPTCIDAQPRADTGMSQEMRLELRALRKEIVRTIMAAEPPISVRELQQRIERVTRRPISESTTQSLMTVVREEMRQADATEYTPPLLMREMTQDSMGE